MNKYLKNFCLVLTTIIWGFAFVAQSVAMDALGPFSFVAIRFFIGAMFLLIIGMISNQFKNINFRQLIKHGIYCGLALYSGVILQQIGMVYTKPGKASFITVLYIVFVPILSIFIKKRVTLRNWICVLISLFGLYFLCIKDSFYLEIGDSFLILSALGFALHIMVIDKYANMYSAICLNCVQYFLVSIISFVLSIFIESFDISNISNAIIPLLYTGILSTGVAYTLQTVGQKDNDPTVVSLILSLESVFGAIGGFLILHQSLTSRELLGSAMIFLAIIIIQLPSRKTN